MGDSEKPQTSQATYTGSYFTGHQF